MVSISSIQLYHNSCLSSRRNVRKNLASCRFTLSTIFAYGCRIEVRIIFIPLSFSVSFHLLHVNCVPRSASIFCAFPMSLMNSSIYFTVASQVALFNGYSFVYFVNVSIITKIYSYPYFVLTRGPKKSMDSSSNGSSGCNDSWITADDVLGISFR